MASVVKVPSLFREEAAIGRLMLLEPDPSSRFKLTIWFDYTRKLVNAIREGDLVAIPNFGADDRFSLCEIFQVVPTHFAMATDVKGYPGFLMDAAKSASQDWTLQEEKSYEDTTKIVCEAIPMNLEFVDKPGLVALHNIPVLPKGSVPMPGKEVRLVSSELTERIINYGIPKEKSVFEIGTLLRDEKVPVRIDLEDFVKTHFGVFGYTGVGKSNLISTVISKVLDDTRDVVNVCLFDLMGEYLGLLIDLMISSKIESKIVCLGVETLPGPALAYVSEARKPPETTQASTSASLDSVLASPSKAKTPNPGPIAQPKPDLDSAARSLLDTALLPKRLKSRTEEFLPHIKQLVQLQKLRVLYEPYKQTLRSFIERNKQSVYGRIGEPKRIALDAFLGRKLQALMDQELTSSLATTVISTLGGDQGDFGPQLSVLIERLKDVVHQPQVDVRREYGITLTDIVRSLNSPKNRSLFIVISHDPNKIREFSRELISESFEQRRRTGQITPLSLFVFDEADEFIPANIQGSSYADSTEAVEMLARRGRKFGLGVGIATQRVTYLNTSIMAQPHTYFVSKLPRETDRERVSEAFAIGNDILIQTFKFHKGNWLIMSHDALGVEGVPIPIKSHNAEDRINSFLNNEKPS